MHQPPPSLDDGTAIERVRALCLALPQVSERASHGRPAFFIAAKRSFVNFMDNHHDDGRLALWCAAPEGVQAAVVTADPERYFVPPYVGHRGWLGVRLDRGLGWDEIAGVLEDAYTAVAPTGLVEEAALRWREGGGSPPP
ncbi:MAG TPA: MmcQ/YjbR family DNA-binding protein [Gaiellales bacterium]